jgi:predicted RNA-binding protein
MPDKPLIEEKRKMRMATIYIAEPGEAQDGGPLLTDVISIERKHDSLKISDLYGRHREVRGFIRKIDFITMVVVIEKEGLPETSVHGA